jgi:hypothetical protein
MMKKRASLIEAMLQVLCGPIYLVIGLAQSVGHLKTSLNKYDVMVGYLLPVAVQWQLKSGDY